MERHRLEALFGRVWQAALDRAGILSRRRAREIGAGEDASEAIEATIELLERLPPSQWPARWHGLGKTSDRCPTLAIPRLQEHLVDGMIDREHAVIFWDGPAMDGPAAPPVRNVAVGFLPKGAFKDLPPDDDGRSRWQLWQDQWGYSNGLPLVSGILRTAGATPEGVAAQWIHRGGLEGEALEAAFVELEARVVGFSRRRVHELVEGYRTLYESDGDDEGGED